MHFSPPSQGGGMHVMGGTVQLFNSTFAYNKAGSVCDFYLDSNSNAASIVSNVTFSQSYALCTTSMIVIEAQITIRCPLGTWMPATPLNMPPTNFSGCPEVCAQGLSLIHI